MISDFDNNKVDVYNIIKVISFIKKSKSNKLIAQKIKYHFSNIKNKTLHSKFYTPH